MSLVIHKKVGHTQRAVPNYYKKDSFFASLTKMERLAENTDRWYYTHVFRVHSYPPTSHLTLDYMNLTGPITKCKEFFHAFPSLLLHMSRLCKYHFWHEAQMQITSPTFFTHNIYSSTVRSTHSEQDSSWLQPFFFFLCRERNLQR